MSQNIVNAYRFGGAGATAICGGGYNPPNDKFYTWDATTDTWSTLITYAWTIYNHGGSGYGGSDAFFFGGYTSGANNTKTQHWNGVSFSGGNPITWSGDNQCMGSGTSGNGFVSGEGMASYGTRASYGYNGTWLTGSSNAYCQRNGAQAGDRDNSAICAGGYGKSGASCSTGSGQNRAEASVRSGDYLSAWATITVINMHVVQGMSGGTGGDASGFTFLGGYSSTGTTWSNGNSSWNGISWTSNTPLTDGKYSGIGTSSNDMDNVLLVGGVGGTPTPHAYQNEVILWDGIAEATKAPYPISAGYGAGGFWT